MAMADNRNTGRDSNPDPITGAPGSHPVGTGVGAAGGGAAGAAIGSVAGPIGTAVGAIVGAVAGGLAGKGVGEMIDPTGEDKYWRENYSSRSYVDRGTSYDEYAPAYRMGWESSQRFKGHSFDQAEPNLKTDWERTKGQSKLSWDKAKLAVKDAWDRTTGGTSQTTRGAAASAAMANEALQRGGEARVPVVQEELKVGKREVETGGGVRVRTEIEERPVQEQVNLREEHVRVERHAVDRPATQADVNQALHGRTIEVREKSEQPVVSKEARVVEEVVVGKEATQRTETVRDTVRRTDVEVEQVDKTNPAAGNTGNAARRSDRPA